VSPLRVEFHRAPEPTEPEPPPAPGSKPPPPPPPEPSIAVVSWKDGRAIVESDDPTLAEGLRRAFRPTPVVVDDPARRYPGTRGESILKPGDLEWFRAVALVRAPAETGLVPRFVPSPGAGGYDPAANYRPFAEQVERLEARNSG
jgi:hypothetical protein